MLLQHIGNVRGFAAFKNIRNKTELVKRVKYTVSRHLSLCNRLLVEKPSVRPNYTHSYSHGTTETPLTSKTIGTILKETVERFPDRECVVFCDGNRRRTFSQLMEEVDKLAAGMMQIGIEKGDRVGIWSPNTLEWVLTQFATARIGAILVTVNPAYQTREMEHAMNLAGCKGLVSSIIFKTQDYHTMLRTVAPEFRHCGPGHLLSKNLPDLRTVIMIGEESLPGTFKFSEILAAAEPQEVLKVQHIQDKMQFDHPVCIQFTSITTGLTSNESKIEPYLKKSTLVPRLPSSYQHGAAWSAHFL